MTDFVPRPVRLTSVRERGRVRGRNMMFVKKGGCAPPSPAPIFFLFVAMQIERILDKKEKHASKRNEASETTFPNLPAANMMFASRLVNSEW